MFGLPSISRISCFCVLAVVLYGPVNGSADQPASASRPWANRNLGPPGPFIGPLDQTFLMNFARRVVGRSLRNSEPYEAVYVPDTLKELTCSVAVTLRCKGLLVGTGDSDILPVLDGCRQAVDLSLIHI